ncbi:hypothetical protein GCM10011416_13450 [Polaribacter pacificus]|uniref:beta-N-acetylhexosaminidase n=1 Tax=Polaribacter pacificus TaxID=1775173 RepID=A0A917HZ48_9FLAO|nr:family 20 glycosylhydrolase [Polaribacter pacificus]GGG96866.1 hypothetical protein GCM10011416_13450 [Polaribacter pacificus]
MYSKKIINYPLLLAISFIFLFTSCGTKTTTNLNSDISLVPFPKELHLTPEKISVKNGIQVKTTNTDLKLLQKIIDPFFSTKNISTSTSSFSLIPSINSALEKDTYLLTITNSQINLEAGSYTSLAYGTTTLLQLIDENNNLSTGSIKDFPSLAYRGLMLDLSRAWYDVSTVKQIISLCSWYKINYLQMHLTDDALFTFQSDSYPKLASKNSYSKKDLQELNQFAIERGVVLVPEIDVPGHSSGFVRTMPDLFGLKNVASNPYTLNMGNEKVYQALDVLFGEVAEAFPYSPYMHIGGDEVFTEGFESDPLVQNYLKEHQLDNVEELYRHFLVRATDIVKSKGKQPILWSGFEREGKVKIPNDVIIMNWKPADYSPQEMIDDGYSIINASWQPLYVVNNRKWSPETIYNWNPFEWKGFQTPAETKGLIAKKSDKVVGASMEVWEQSQYKAFSSLIDRLPAMSEKIWNSSSTTFDVYSNRVKKTKATIENMVFPFTLDEKGLTFEKNKEPNFSEDMWFSNRLTLSITPLTKDISLRYTLDGSKPNNSSLAYTKPIEITKNTQFSLQAFKNNKPLGQTLLKSYTLVPVEFKIDGLVNQLSPNSWEKHKFIDAMTVTLKSSLKGEIRYTTDNTTPKANSKLYTKPFTIKNSIFLKARLFDKKGNPIGGMRSDEYERLQLEKSLTTNKPVTTSNKFEGGVPALINDGKITRWDHWGAHTNGNNWVVIDLEKEQTVKAFKVYTFWDGYRYYEYTIETSVDNKNWNLVVDRSKNREKSVPEGQLDSITPVKARYIKLRLIRNSSNPGLHLVEFQAF